MSGTAYVTTSSLEDCLKQWLAALSPWQRGRELPHLQRSALILVDLQRYFGEPDSHAYLPALSTIAPRLLTLVKSFKDAKRPVILTRQGLTNESLMSSWWPDQLHRGEKRAELLPEFASLEAQLLVDKKHYSAFLETTLLDWLTTHECDTLVIGGVMTHLCCESTARDAFMRGIKPVLLADGCASIDEELHVGSLRNLAHGFAVISSTQKVACALGQKSLSPQTFPPPTETIQADLAIIGAGPAGIAAAICAKREGMNLVWLADATANSQTLSAEWIENYPGFPGGISGKELLRRFATQAAQFDLVKIDKKIDEITQADEVWLFYDAEKKIIAQTRAVILATGASTKPLTIEGGSLALSTVDELPFIKDQTILVVGSGETAIDQAILAKRRRAKRAIVAIRSAHPKAIARLIRRAERFGVEFFVSAEVKKISTKTRSGQTLLSVELICLQDGKEVAMEVDQVIARLGQTPKLPPISASLQLGHDGRPTVDQIGRTSARGLYLAGDVRRGNYRQVGIAVGDGLAAAMDARKYLAEGIWINE